MKDGAVCFDTYNKSKNNCQKYLIINIPHFQSPNKDFVRKILVDAFMFKESQSNQNTLKYMSSALEIDNSIAEKVKTKI